jgi:hypothetical protein
VRTRSALRSGSAPSRRRRESTAGRQRRARPISPARRARGGLKRAAGWIVGSASRPHMVTFATRGTPGARSARHSRRFAAGFGGRVELAALLVDGRSPAAARARLLDGHPERPAPSGTLAPAAVRAAPPAARASSAPSARVGSAERAGGRAGAAASGVGATDATLPPARSEVPAGLRRLRGDRALASRVRGFVRHHP